MFFVYILHSEVHDGYYIGQTNNIQDRLRRHNNRSEKATAPYVPWQLLWKTSKPSRSEALKLERKLKNLSRDRIRKFIDKYPSE